MTTKTTTEGVRVLALRAFTAPLATPLDALGLPRADVIDRGQEATVTAEWYAEHVDSGAYVAADAPEADQYRLDIAEEQEAAREAEYKRRLRGAQTADDRAEIRLRERRDLAANAAAVQASHNARNAA